MRIAIVYDCLYPYTIGGAERWYRSLAEGLAARHDVTYITRRQWPRAQGVEPPRGVRVIVVSGGGQLYTASGRRRVFVPLRFGWGVFRHLLRHRHDYDIVHTCAFPYFSLLAGRAAGALGGPPMVVDWLEVWSRKYWREYLGRLGGGVGAAVQRLCARLTGTTFVLSELQATHLLAAGYRGQPIPLRGLYDGPGGLTDAATPREPLVVYIGRHIPEKRVEVIPETVARARERIPGLQAVIFGDGPQRQRVIAAAQRLGMEGAVRCPGFVDREEVEATLERAMCLLLPSRREGYGLVVVEAAARGTPTIVVGAPDNAASELVSDGINGFIAESAEPAVLAAAIAAVHAGGAPLRQRTCDWFISNRDRLTITGSIAQVEAVYRQLALGYAKRKGRQTDHRRARDHPAWRIGR